MVYRNDLKNRLLPRRRPDFEPGQAGTEAAQLKEFSDAGGLKSSGWPTPAETDFSGYFGITLDGKERDERIVQSQAGKREWAHQGRANA